MSHSHIILFETQNYLTEWLANMDHAACGSTVTEQGGILTHAAIIARELNIPCITSVKNVTQILKTGDRVIVDASGGSIRRATKQNIK